MIDRGSRFPAGLGFFERPLHFSRFFVGVFFHELFVEPRLLFFEAEPCGALFERTTTKCENSTAILLSERLEHDSGHATGASRSHDNGVLTQRDLWTRRLGGSQT